MCVRAYGIVGGLGCFVTMSRLDLVRSYSELSTYVQFQVPGQPHREGASSEHVLHDLRETWNKPITYTCGSRRKNELWGGGSTLIGQATQTPDDHTVAQAHFDFERWIHFLEKSPTRKSLSFDLLSSICRSLPGSPRGSVFS